MRLPVPPPRPVNRINSLRAYEAAVACYHDPAYMAAAEIRHSIADGMQSIVEGYDGPQDF